MAHTRCGQITRSCNIAAVTSLTILSESKKQGGITERPGPAAGRGIKRLQAAMAAQPPMDQETRGIVKIAKPTVEISDKVRLNLEKFVWSSREK